MQVEGIPALQQILDDFSDLLYQVPHGWLWQRETESSPLLIDLSFHPPARESTIEKVLRSDVCTRCSRRISYKPGQFGGAKPDLPYLILVHNAFLSDRHDQERVYYQNPKVDSLFRLIIEKSLGQPAERFLVREVLRCHFGSADVNHPDWLQQCKHHLFEDIQNYSLKGILVIGDAARLLFPEASDLEQRVSRVSSLLGLPLVVSPGPARLEYMQGKNYPEEKIREEKIRIYQALKLFRQQVLER